MASKENLRISQMGEDELLDRMDELVMRLERRFGGEATDALLYQLVAQRVERIYKGGARRGGGGVVDQVEDTFCLDHVEQMTLDDCRPKLNAIFARIEVQLGNAAAEKIMYQVMYRLGLRIGKYDEQEGDDTDDDDEDDEWDEEFMRGGPTVGRGMFVMGGSRDPYEWVLRTTEETSKEASKEKREQVARSLDDISEDINKANEERELMAKS